MIKTTFSSQIDDFRSKGEKLEDPFFSELSPLPDSVFIPAHIYTFFALPVDDQQIPTADQYLDAKAMTNYSIKRPYYDQRPIGICLANDAESVTILNLKIMPLGATQVILNILWQTLNSIIRKSYDDKGQFINDTRKLYQLPEYAPLMGFNSNPFAMVDLFQNASGGKFNVRYAVNKYQKEAITNPKLIPFHLVPRIAQTNIFDGIQTRSISMESVISQFNA
jgi:hypothetical protein